MKLTMYQLKQYANKFLADNYGMKLTVPLELNGRLSRACGRFCYSKYRDGRKIAKKVELNRYFAENNEPTVVLDVLRHELVHYALFMLGKPHSDGQSYFERELKRLGVVSQSTVDKYIIQSKPRNLQVYQCVECKKEYTMKRKLPNNGANHRCRCAKEGRLIDRGKRVVAS